MMHTQVTIVGAGPAGLLLAHLLDAHNIESIVIEKHSRDHIESRVRAGVLEQGTVDTLVESGVGDRLKSQGLVHQGLELSFEGRRHRLNLQELTGGRAITVYGQQEVIKDLIKARLDKGRQILFEVGEVSIDDPASNKPSIRFRHNHEVTSISCDFVAGCDGFHGISRSWIPRDVLTIFEQTWPFSWLGILAKSKPPSSELIYCNHSRGFALFSMRSPEITRLYVQCEPDENLEQWPDERIWEELEMRLGAGDNIRLEEGPILQKGISSMRSFVVEPMQYGRLFLAGDAAHIVPATGAKGMNLAVADVRILARALSEYYSSGGTKLLEGYSDACLRRVWRAQHFSSWMTSLLHRFPDSTPFKRQLQLAELDYVTRSIAASKMFAENYTGLPFDY